jgi:hypothetical protein
LIGTGTFSGKRGGPTGPNPVDRGKSGSKVQVLSDRRGIPLAAGVSAADTHNSQALRPLVMVVPAVRSRRGPRHRRPDKLHADKAYDSRDLRAWVRDRGIGVRIARKGIESGEKLGRHRWVIERAIAWVFNYRRLAIQHECHGNTFCTFLTLAAQRAVTPGVPGHARSVPVAATMNQHGSHSGADPSNDPLPRRRGADRHPGVDCREHHENGGQDEELSGSRVSGLGRLEPHTCNVAEWPRPRYVGARRMP